MMIKNATKGTVLAAHAGQTRSFFGRLKGLLGERGLSSGQALVIWKCRSVHMFGMRFPIDVVFINRLSKVIRIFPNLKPWSFSSFIPASVAAIELPAGTAAITHTKPGDQLIFV